MTTHFIIPLLFVFISIGNPWSYADEKDAIIEETLDSFEKEKDIQPDDKDVLTNQNAEIIPDESPVDISVPTEPFPVVSPADPLPEDQEEPFAPKRVERIDLLDFKDADINDALYVIEKKSGLMISVDPNVQGLVTIYLQDIEVLDALKVILAPHGLAYIEENDLIRVMSGDVFESEYGYRFDEMSQTRIVQIEHAELEEVVTHLVLLKSEDGKIIVDTKTQRLILMDSPEYLEKMEALIKEVDVPLKTEVFPLQYARVDDIKKEVDERLTENIGLMEYDTRANKIVITDTPTAMEEITRFIKEADKKIEVSIKAQVIRIQLNEQHHQGIDWEAIVSDYQSAGLSGGEGSRPLINSQLKMGSLTGEDFDVLLEALETVGKVSTVVDIGLTAIVNRAITVALNTNTAAKKMDDKAGIPSSPSSRQPMASNGFKIQLQITPVLGEEQSLVMKLFPKVTPLAAEKASEVERQEEESYSPPSDIIVDLKKYETIVIGGLLREKKVKRITKFPILGNLPLLGFAFHHQTSFLKKTEYIIFLTQKIIKKESPTSLEK